MTPNVARLLGIDPPSNPELIGVPLVALQRAHETKTDSGDAHIVEVLLRIGSVADGLAAVGVDVERARRGLERIIAGLPRSSAGARFLGIFRRTRIALDPFARARAHALAAGLKELTAPFTLAVLVDGPDAADILRALEEAGFSLPRYRRYVAHRGAVDAPCPEVGQVRVVFHDDPFTTMEFVMEILTRVFGRDQATAESLMKRVHEEGRAALATMDAAVAAAAIADVRARAEAGGWPLRVTAELVTSGSAGPPPY